MLDAAVFNWFWRLADEDHAAKAGLPRSARSSRSARCTASVGGDGRLLDPGWL